MKNDILQELNWEEVRLSIEQVNPALAKIVNNISPNNRYKLIKATYSFGDLIIKEGRLCLPIDDKKLYTQLNYSPIPLSLSLNKSVEVFIENNGCPLPLNILNPGDFFGTFEVCNSLMNKQSYPIWNVSAGARTTFMLPQISDFSGIKRLRSHYNIAQDVQVRSLADHWNLFKQITFRPNFTQPWRNEVLFFPKQWLMEVKDIAWFKFYQLIWEQTWQQAQYAMSGLNLRNEWQTCLKMLSSRRLKPSPYIMDTIKHLLIIMRAFAPCLAPTNALEQDLPLTELQRAFTDIYLLDRYVPSIMSPSIFREKQSSSIGYYSLAFPTLISGSHPVKLLTAFMPDLKMIKLIMNHLIENNKKSSSLHNVFLQYFHASPDKFHDVQLSHEIPIADPTFQRDQQKFPDRIFCANSPFWRGCIRICSKPNDKNL